MKKQDVPKRIRAAVFTGPDRPFEIREFPCPKLKAGEVLVRVRCCALCGSDLHTYFGRRHTPTPTILGHETMGDIAALGPGKTPRDAHGRKLRVGDRVTWSVVASCGECFFCHNDLPQKCERMFKYGHESCRNGRPLSGGLAEYCHLAAHTTIVRLPSAVPDAVAASANCATATSLAAIDAAGGCRDRDVLIQGAGLLGLTAAAAAATQGAASILVTDVDADRLTWVRRFGATAAIDVAESPRALVTAVDEITRGRGVDVALEMSGSTAAFEATLPRVRVGGTCVLVGAVRPSRPASIDVDTLVRRMLTLRGMHNYGPRHLVAAVDFLAEHAAAFPFDQLVGGEYPLADADEAFRRSDAGGAIRGVVRIHS